jgi:3D (Asp-Asp-Asp) domain-containing protein
MIRLDAIIRSISDRFPAGGRESGAMTGLADTSREARRLAFGLLFALTACATASVPSAPRAPEAPLNLYARGLMFLLSEPPPQALGPDLQLWATHYHTPIVTPAPKEMSAAFPLLGRDGAPISPPLRQKDWCEAALQGSVSVQSGSKAKAYAFIDDDGPEQTDCDAWLGDLSDAVKLATRKARFTPVSHSEGCGVRNIPLMPFRTIAVDASIVPIGSVIYVPELRGRAFRYNGHDYVHDGYLFAGDRGGAIRGRHIDVFMTDDPETPLEDLFASTRTRTFEAHIVDADDPAADAVRANHSSQCDETAVAAN